MPFRRRHFHYFSGHAAADVSPIFEPLASRFHYDAASGQSDAAATLLMPLPLAAMPMFSCRHCRLPLSSYFRCRRCCRLRRR